MSALQEIAIDYAATQASIEAQQNSEPPAHSVSPGRFSAWFSGLRIGSKIRFFFLTNLAFALVAGLFVIVGYIQLGERAQTIAQEQDYAIVGERLVAVLGEAQGQSELFVATGERLHADAAIERLDVADSRLSELREKIMGSDPASGQHLARTQSEVDALRTRILAPVAKQSDPLARQAQASAIQAAASLTLEAARDLAANLSDNVKAHSEEGVSFISTLLISWLAFVGILTALTLIAQRYFDRNVGGAITAITGEMNKLASGDNNVQIPGQRRRDEIGDMARALMVFHHGAKRLELLSRERAQKAKADLEEQAARQREEQETHLERERMLHEVADQFERTVGEVANGVAEASSQLQTTSKMMAETADQSSQRAREVSASMQGANSGATAAAAASDEFAMSISEISRQAASSAELARKATGAATEADETISALSDSAQQVGQIVELIQTIAQRTNLLALNASIEAARGGEAGRGFAVVASEVKELAMQTSRATEQVAEQIRTMQDTTGNSVTALQSIVGQVQELETTAISIASAVDQQAVAGEDLARSIDMAARGTEEVTDHVNEVRDLSLSTGSAASQVHSSATSLEEQAAALREQMDVFLRKVRVN